MGKLVTSLAVFLIIGAPMAFYIWHTLSDLLAGSFRSSALLVSLVLIVAFFVVLRFLGRYVRSIAAKQ